MVAVRIDQQEQYWCRQWMNDSIRSLLVADLYWCGMRSRETTLLLMNVVFSKSRCSVCRTLWISFYQLLVQLLGLCTQLLAVRDLFQQTCGTGTVHLNQVTLAHKTTETDVCILVTSLHSTLLSIIFGFWLKVYFVRAFLVICPFFWCYLLIVIF